jgi:glyceraldehyde 3-phosphate dehydrogenase
MVTIAIQGFGRIGRTFLRVLLADKDAWSNIRVAVINIGPANPEMVLHSFKYDSLMGTYQGEASYHDGMLEVGGRRIVILHEPDVTKIAWSAFGVEWVIDCSGRATHREKAQLHLQAGAKKVLISAPAHNEDVAIIPGVNDAAYDSVKHTIVSLGSCTTNALLPTLHILDTAYTIVSAMISTVHAYTNSQVLLDVESMDMRRSRAAAINIVPTTTGATEMVSKVLPNLAHKVSGYAVRVPVAKVSWLEVIANVAQKTDRDAVVALCERAARTDKKGIVAVTKEPLVSSDFAGDPHSIIIDAQLCAVNGSLVRVCGWYDNEWGYSCRMKDFLLKHG